MKRNKKEFIFLSLSPTGVGVSGSDRIFIELAREWSKKIPVTIYTTQEGVEMGERQRLTGKHLTINKVEKGLLPSNFFLKYLYKIFLGIRLGLTWSPHNTLYKIHNTLLYSSSDFWMDVFPTVILKIRYPKLKWVATWYQTAPNPIRGYVETKSRQYNVLRSMYNASCSKSDKRQVISDKNKNRAEKYKLSAMFYWLSQLPIKPLIIKYADYVIVNNEDERKRFPEMDKKGKVIVLLGAVRLDEIERYKTSHHSLTTDHKSKIYSAVFQGRFHPQKGVVELIDIWKKVVDKIPNAKLAMIGDGPLMNEVRTRLTEHRLQNNVKLFGYVFDGEEKYKIFAQSKIVVHPAFYDSGGMASAEAMAFGLPCVGFKLKAYESYYPKGMLKAYNENEFSSIIVKLLSDSTFRKIIGNNARNLIEKQFSWESRSEQLLSKLL